MAAIMETIRYGNNCYTAGRAYMHIEKRKNTSLANYISSLLQTLVKFK